MQRSRAEQQEIPVVDIPLPSVSNLPRINYRANTSVTADQVIIGVTHESDQLPIMASATIIQDEIIPEAMVSPSSNVILNPFEVEEEHSQSRVCEAVQANLNSWGNLYVDNSINNEVEVSSTTTFRSDFRITETTNTATNTTTNTTTNAFIRKSFTERISESLFGEVASVHDISREVVEQRELLAYEIIRKDNCYDVLVNLKQYRLKYYEKSPQGRRNDVQLIGTYNSYERAFEACISHTPPVWDSKKDVLQCSICSHSFGLLNVGHHCRNCGKIVCLNCSDKYWNSKSLPDTYHNAEVTVRVCDICVQLNQQFYESLLAGDYNKCKAINSTGNVNVHCPFSNFSDNNKFNYAVHLAAISGNVLLMKWLIEVKFCTVLATDGSPLLGYSSESVFELACKHGNVDIMKYLIQSRHAVVTEVKNMSILYRALHSLLDAPVEEMPAYKSNNTNYFFDKYQNENIIPEKEQQGHKLKRTKSLNEIAQERVTLSLAINESNNTAEL